MELIEQIKKDLKEILSERRYIHSIGVMERAEELARIYGVDIEKAKITGLAHDIAKEMTEEEKMKYVKEKGIEIDEVEKINTSILHGKIGADIVKTRYNFDADMQKAIINHTITDPNMDMLSKIIYVADKTEKNRNSEKYNIEYERQLADKDINEAIIYILNSNINYLIETRKIIHPKSIETRNYLIIKK